MFSWLKDCLLGNSWQSSWTSPVALSTSFINLLGMSNTSGDKRMPCSGPEAWLNAMRLFCLVLMRLGVGLPGDVGNK